MAGVVVTVSPRVPVDEYLRLARSRVAQGGIAPFVAASGDPRQVRHLRRLGHRLADDDTLDCYLGDHGDGGLYLTVFLRADRDRRRGLGWLGEGKTS